MTVRFVSYAEQNGDKRRYSLISGLTALVVTVVMARLMAGRITCRPPVPLAEEYGAENEKLCPLATEKPVCAKGSTLFGLLAGL